jgi:ribosomal protein L7Ae-like RNA K-turn-binding protein
MYRPDKRKRRQHPTWIDLHSTEALVNSRMNVMVDIHNHSVPEHTKNIFLERLKIEILERFQFYLKSQASKGYDGDEALGSAISKQRLIVKQRILIGINACTRALEVRKKSCQSTSSALLLILGTDIQPTCIAAHVSSLAKQMSQPVPIFVLPGISPSKELGAVLGTKNASCILFLSRPQSEGRELDDDEESVHQTVDSFIAYFRSKIV